MNALYPLKFRPLIKEAIWGGEKLEKILGKDTGGLAKAAESWEISSVEGSISEVSNGLLTGNNLKELIEVYMGDLVGDRIFEKYGTEFPLLLKFIDANDFLSIQVHPDDALSGKRHHAYGKTEMWYVLQADPGSTLISGFNKPLDKETYLHHFKNGTLTGILNQEQVAAGDVFYIPAGRVHAIGPGILLAEIQQTSDITYRIHDWDRVDKNGKGRELHTGMAVDAIDYGFHENYKTVRPVVPNRMESLIQCPYFSTSILNFNRSVERDYSMHDAFVIFMGIRGRFRLNYVQGTEFVNMGETVLVPASITEVELVPEGEAGLLEVTIV